MTHEGSAALRELVDQFAPVRQLGSGFAFTEGPVWHPSGYLLFSDMPGDVRRRWDRAGVRDVMLPSNKANGLTFDAALNLIACEHATSSLVRFAPDGRRTVLASHFDGRELNSPNDVVVHSDGSIWFTDPWYGRMPVFGVERPRELGFQGVYRLADGELRLVVERYLFTQPNGLCFSPDERLLYVNDTVQALVRVFNVGVDGRLSGGRVFASGIVDTLKPGLPDGMKCDAAGNVWVTAPGGIWVYAADGTHLGKVAIPELAANFHWGGEDWRTLFVCASTSLYAVDVKVGPRNEPFMRTRGAASGMGTGPGRAPSHASASFGAGAADASSSPSSAHSQLGAPSHSSAPSHAGERSDDIMLSLDPARCALIIQDMQNDVVSEGGAFASSGAPSHCREQNAVANAARLADACRARNIPVIHVHFLVPPGARGMTLNAPLFEGVADGNAMVRGTWGAAPVAGLEPHQGDHIVEKMRMSAWEGTSLETVLKAEGRDVIIECGAWTNMSIEHTARTGADKGYVMVIPEDACSTMNADWHRASIEYAMQNVAAVTSTASVLAALG